MKPLRSLAIIAVISLIAPSAMKAQIKESQFREGSTSTSNKIINGNEVIQVNKEINTKLTGNINQELIGISLSGNGITGNLNGLMINLFEQQMEGLLPGGEIDASLLQNNPAFQNALQEDLQSTGLFNLTGQVTKQNAEYGVESDSKEVVNVVTTNSFEDNVTTESYEFEEGFISSFSD